MQRSLIVAIVIMGILPFASFSKAIETGKDQKDLRTDFPVEKRNMDDSVLRRNDNNPERSKQDAEHIAVIRESRNKGILSDAVAEEITSIIKAHRKPANFFSFSSAMRLNGDLTRGTGFYWTGDVITESTYLSLLESGKFEPLGQNFVYRGRPLKFGYAKLTNDWNGTAGYYVGVEDNHGGLSQWALAGSKDLAYGAHDSVESAQLWSNGTQILMKMSDGAHNSFFLMTGEPKNQ